MLILTIISLLLEFLLLITIPLETEFFTMFKKNITQVLFQNILLTPKNIYL